ncbi:glycoside hydrolase family 9 protein [Cellulomonas edaphi]|uniref:Glycoside hydrolase family 9 protein n=1 Tax=Cellulomonas edaphi TaxID=3053468 RepID=A0ABT7S7J3_9CELL|nr:glycoside hydrolase family 9 protein [Cellulomons edaphi]MDM7831582.1 glycoside hydrolase family 9 protein [Cellulomons edaphi]
MSWPRWSSDEVLARRPRVRVNQLGYLPGRPMRATLVAEHVDPLPFVVVRADERVVHRGVSEPWPVRPEPTSGLPVHVLDLGDLPAGTYSVAAGSSRSHPFSVEDRLYAGLRTDALRFFSLMRSGTEIAAPGYERPAGHPDTSVPAWTGPDAERLYPGWHDDAAYDVSGGWYDAGDYGKYVTSGAIAVWQLLGTLDLTPDDPAVVDECRWQLDWLLRMQVPPGRPLAGMAFHRVHGSTWPPLPCWPHLDATERVLHRPSTTATLHLAAAAAAGARHLRRLDPAYAARLERAARSAFDAARSAPALLAPDDHARHGGGPYHDDVIADDRAWAASELWLATGDSAYESELPRAHEHGRDPFDPAGFDFDAVAAPAQLDLALHGSALTGHDQIVDRLRAGADRLLALQADQPWGQPYAPASGWAWGSNGRVLNNLVVLGMAHLVTGERSYADAVAIGADYLLGRNALGQSYVTGYGTDDSRHQRTRQFGHDLDPAMPPPPPGALAGGANSVPVPDFPYDDRLRGLPPQLCYLDEPTSEVTNDVCIRWNAPLVWVATFLTA